MFESAVNVGSTVKDPGDEIKWVPLSLSFVEYPQGDWFGKLFAAASISPLGIIAGFVALILFRRDLHTIVFFSGMLVNELINQILKHTICQLRPIHRDAHTLYSEYGMPSAHSQFIWFFSSYVIYFVFIRLHHMNNNLTLETVWKAIITVGCLSLAVIVSVGRVYLQYHTWAQVLWGAVIGFLFAFVWFSLTHFILTPYFPIVVSWRASEMLLLRDTTLIPNVMWFEYTNTRQEARMRGRKLGSCKPQ